MENEGENGDISAALSEEFGLEVQSLIFAESRAKKVPGPDDMETKNHLIQLLATFEVYNRSPTHPTYYMLFPWADGDLGDFWKRYTGRYKPKDKKHLGWMVDQFYHLAKALQCVHNERGLALPQPVNPESNRFGRHGDIKPKNFLYFLDSGEKGPDLGIGVRIVITDFGLGRLYSKESRSKQTPSQINRTESYAAPEYDLDGGKVSPTSDIFSLGCVFFEHLVWLFTELKGLESFHADRLAEREPPTSPYPNWKMDRFWKCTDSKTAVLKDCVRKALDEFRERKDCVEVVGEMLEVIEHMLHTDRARRCDSIGLVDKLDKIRRKWKRQDSFYATRSWKKSMWPPIFALTFPLSSGHVTCLTAYNRAQKLIGRFCSQNRQLVEKVHSKHYGYGRRQGGFPSPGRNNDRLDSIDKTGLVWKCIKRCTA